MTELGFTDEEFKDAGAKALTRVENDAYHANLPDVSEPLKVLAEQGFEAFDKLISSLEDDELDALGAAFARRAKFDSYAVGRTAYEIRTRTPDGQWGREVKKLAMSWEVSDRTIHRWMSAYQEVAGALPTAAQANARASAEAVSRRREEELSTLVDDQWDDEEEAAAAGFWESNPVDNGSYMRGLVGEPDNPAPAEPTTRYENAPEPERPAGRPVVAPDDTWVAFASAQIAAEHEGYGDQALERMAKARWDRTVREDPLSLLEDLEDIHVAGVPDALVEALHAAEEAKAIKPEVVADKPKKPRKAGASSASGKVAKLADPQAGFANVENGMAYTREVHEHIAHLLDEGGPEMLMRVYGKALDNMAAWAFTLDGCLKKVRKARDDVKRGEGRQERAGPAEPAF